MKLKTKIAIYVGSCILASFLCLWYLGLFRCTAREQYYRVISDTFFVLGGITSGISLISFCVSKGLFDSLTGRHLKEDSEKKKRSWLKILGACGAVMLLIGVVFGFLI